MSDKQSLIKPDGFKSLPKIPSDNKPITNLSVYTEAELLELRDRQKHLLANKKRWASLPDKGARIRALYERILIELATRDDVNKASELFSVLNIAAAGKSHTIQMEWNGQAKVPAAADEVAATVVADDAADELNPLKILAQSRQSQKQITIEPPVETLITAVDRQEIAEFNSEKSTATASELEPHALYMCSIDDRHPVKKERFLPHKTTVEPTAVVHRSPDKADKAIRKSGAHNWENTSATPPALRNNTLVALSLQDSIEIQRKQQEAMKAIDLQHAAERLSARDKLTAKLMAETFKSNETPSALFGSYRSPAAAHSDGEDEDDPDATDSGDDDTEEAHDD